MTGGHSKREVSDFKSTFGLSSQEENDPTVMGLNDVWGIIKTYITDFVIVIKVNKIYKNHFFFLKLSECLIRRLPHSNNQWQGRRQDQEKWDPP